MLATLPPPIIDVEASGFGSASYPIEVGVAMPDGHGYCSLITPAPGWVYWDANAERVHGVTRETLLRQGRPAKEVAGDINTLLHGQIVYCDSWYHDFTWLSRLFDAGDSVQTFQLEDIRSLLMQHEADQWLAAKMQIVRELGLDRHRASNDARVLQETLLRVRQAPARAISQ